MTLSDGSGYTGASPLSRLHGKVGTGHFTQPVSAVEALDLIDRIARDLPV